MKLSDKHLKLLGWCASICAILMYLSFIDQIRLNLSGAKGSLILPLATVLNCSLWTSYGLFREKVDYPIVVANIPGIVLGIISFVTAL